MSIDLEQYNIPEEVSVKDAATILSVDKKTVLGYIKQSVLPARDASLPSSLRPMWRIKLADVLEMRGGYERQEIESQEAQQRSYKSVPKYEPKILKRK